WRSARSAASGSLARMRINAIVAGSIATRFCSQFRNVATGTPSVLANSLCDIPSLFRIYQGEMMSLSDTSSSGFSPSSIIWRRMSGHVLPPRFGADAKFARIDIDPEEPLRYLPYVGLAYA